jgi:3-hydroxypropanoate dehydrogenase
MTDVRTVETAKGGVRLDEAGLDLLFRGARTRNGWLDRPVDDATIRELYALTRLGPTSANSCPARFVFIRSPEAKARLFPHLYPANVEKTQSAPCTVIVAGDTRFYELFPQLFPSRDLKSMFEGNDALITDTMRRNTTMQGSYMLMAARALGLDCGPMSGFHPAQLDAEFFPDGRWKSDFLFNLGYGSDENLYPRNPRLEFDQACLDL